VKIKNLINNSTQIKAIKQPHTCISIEHMKYQAYNDINNMSMQDIK